MGTVFPPEKTNPLGFKTSRAINRLPFGRYYVYTSPRALNAAAFARSYKPFLPDRLPFFCPPSSFPHARMVNFNNPVAVSQEGSAYTSPSGFRGLHFD